MFPRGCILLLEHHVFKPSVNLWDRNNVHSWLGFEPEINPTWMQENQADIKKCTLRHVTLVV